MKNSVYNVVILDKSGSMSDMRHQAVGCVNETFGSIRTAAKQNDGQSHFVTFVQFCNCGLHTIYKNTPIDEVKNISLKDFQPCCGTPLYDAIGNVCTALHAKVKNDPTISVAVTIITDGYENSSREFSAQSIKALIEAYKSEGWLFAYAGANHDVESVAFNLAIDHHLQFEKTDDDIAKMSEAMAKGRMHWCANIQAAFNDLCDDSSPEEIQTSKQKASKNFFF